MNKKIILIGMMGTGKSTLGQLLSEKLNLPYIDLDHQIEKKENLSINNIFKTKGEAYFRTIESALLIDQTKSRKNYILSTGGGLIINEENQTYLKKQNAIIIWLNATSQTILNRIKNSTNRPLLNQENPKMVIENLLIKRNVIYKKLASHIVATDDQSTSQILKTIQKLLEKQEN